MFVYAFTSSPQVRPGSLMKVSWPPVHCSMLLPSFCFCKSSLYWTPSLICCSRCHLGGLGYRCRQCGNRRCCEHSRGGCGWTTSEVMKGRKSRYNLLWDLASGRRVYIDFSEWCVLEILRTDPTHNVHISSNDTRENFHL